ncbi:uncharacterized protein B0I36DRAFT_333472 [Microdochium trichocladiopsis]|uniref:Mid2 domain-containing protein n=1 Tax=Microdochium trichocladiopsis TaxID=1682393 RepID=A0A9P9BK82_9PEZI|nr:uncharacterized protein B0I36DRAFT_333472 [Microdochium trichocladiopsis]KAH7020939.1 hypothetical protein B0I36DRAFT_333472 [Microdochium trichocladiopsis]
MDVAWTALADCRNTAINQTWRVPSTFVDQQGGGGGDGRGGNVFSLVVVNMTSPDAPQTTTGAAFTINPASTAPVLTSSSSSSTPQQTSTGSSNGPTLAAENPSPSSTALSTSQSTSPSSADQQGLTSGVKAGIAMGALAGATVLLFGLVFLWRRRQRRHRHHQKHANDLERDGPPPVEVEAVMPTELDAHSGTCHRSLDLSPATSSTSSCCGAGSEQKLAILEVLHDQYRHHQHQYQHQGQQEGQHDHHDHHRREEQSSMSSNTGLGISLNTDPAFSQDQHTHHPHPAAPPPLQNGPLTSNETSDGGSSIRPRYPSGPVELPGHIPHQEMPAPGIYGSDTTPEEGDSDNDITGSQWRRNTGRYRETDG